MYSSNIYYINGRYKLISFTEYFVLNLKDATYYSKCTCNDRISIKMNIVSEYYNILL